MNNNTLDIKIFLNRSILRQKILLKLNLNEQIATFLAKELKKHRSVISRVLLDLEKKGLAKCINPKSGNYRKYIIAEKGKLYIEKLNT